MGHARIEVQLVTHTDPPRVHAHSLVGRHCTENGTCMVDVGPNDLTASSVSNQIHLSSEAQQALLCDVTSFRFSNLGILHVTKKSVVEVLNKRLREERRRQKAAHCLLTGQASHDRCQPINTQHLRRRHPRRFDLFDQSGSPWRREC